MREMGALVAVAMTIGGCAGGAALPPSPVAQANPPQAVNEPQRLAQPAAYVPPPRRHLKPAEAINEARAEIVALLKDPESARFTDLSFKTTPNARGEPTDVVCGAINAKNSYGGYTGAKPFVYFVDRRDIQMVEGDRFQVELRSTIFNNFCRGGFQR